MRFRGVLPAVVLLLTTTLAQAQWQILDGHTTADLRGIDNVGHGVVWASGTNGTVLRSEDAGYVWQLCAIPPGADHLDFRGIQAVDADTAIVMSSGKGDLSRLYKTTDGCATWKLVFTNPDPEGFWDAITWVDDFETIFILGDPVNGTFKLFSSTVNEDSGAVSKFSDNWNGHRIHASSGEAAFAASNSLFAYDVGDGMFSFVTGGLRSEIIHEEHGIDTKIGMFSKWSRSPLPFDSCGSCGAYSVAAWPPSRTERKKVVVVVGGDYTQPDQTAHTAAFSLDWGNSFAPSVSMPHGYRSAVAYDAPHNTWIAVGPNGTDISTDDGRNWHALRPDPKAGDNSDADQHWNALSLPYVVGPHGHIGKLRDNALPPAPSPKH